MKERVFSDIYGEFYPKITHYLTRLVGDHDGKRGQVEAPYY